MYNLLLEFVIRGLVMTTWAFLVAARLELQTSSRQTRLQYTSSTDIASAVNVRNEKRTNTHIHVRTRPLTDSSCHIHPSGPLPSLWLSPILEFRPWCNRHSSVRPPWCDLVAFIFVNFPPNHQSDTIQLDWLGSIPKVSTNRGHFLVVSSGRHNMDRIWWICR